MDSNMLNVIIIDDHPVVLQGFSFMLQDIPGIRLAETFTDAGTGLAYIGRKEVDIVLLDINMPGKNGIDACSEIQQLNPACKVIAISNINERSEERRVGKGCGQYV